MSGPKKQSEYRKSLARRRSYVAERAESAPENQRSFFRQERDALDYVLDGGTLDQGSATRRARLRAALRVALRIMERNLSESQFAGDLASIRHALACEDGDALAGEIASAMASEGSP